MKKIFLILLLLTNLLMASSEYKSYNDNIFNKIMFRNEIDLDSKSLKGWIRLFNSREKMDRYDYFMSEEERLLFLEGLKTRYNEDKTKYIREIR